VSLEYNYYSYLQYISTTLCRSECNSDSNCMCIMSYTCNSSLRIVSTSVLLAQCQHACLYLSSLLLSIIIYIYFILSNRHTSIGSYYLSSLRRYSIHITLSTRSWLHSARPTQQAQLLPLTMTAAGSTTSTPLHYASCTAQPQGPATLHNAGLRCTRRGARYTTPYQA
jgi:hypothetical protein